MPSTWSWWGDPITARSTASRLAGSDGRSEARKYGPREVPPRISTQGIRRCISGVCQLFRSSIARNTGERRDVYTDSVEVQTVIVPHRGDIMRRTLPLISLALALSFPGCVLGPVATGMDEAQVEARMGKPETVRKGADGSQIWEYPYGPAGRQTYMVILGPDHRMSEIRQVLTNEYFAKVTNGMSRDEV